MATTVATVLVGSRLDCTNSVLYGIIQATFPNFRKFKISWCVLFNTQQSISHTPLQHLQWLPIEYRINDNIANITFNTLRYSQPTYLYSLLCFRTLARSLSPPVPFARTPLGAPSFSDTSPKI